MTLQEWVKLTEGISYLAGVGFAASFIVFWRFLTANEGRELAHARESARAPSLPETLFLHPTHGWLALETGGLARLGLDGFMSRAVGRIDGVELPQPGEQLQAGQPAFAIRQGERRAAVAAPVSGEVVAVNPALGSATLKDKPYSAGWVLRLKPSNLVKELPKLHIAERAKNFLRDESVRLSELVVSHAGAKSGLGATMADGGEAIDGALEHLDDEAWEAFFAAREKSE